MKNQFKQQRSLFFRNIFAFAVIFFSLGLIVNQVLVSSLYKTIDEDLNRLASDDQFIQRELLQTQDKPPKPLENDHLGPMPPSSFKTQAILWSREGEILNQKAMGNRFYEFANLNLEKNKDEKIVSLVIKDAYDNNLNFRSITKKISYQQVDYIQFLVNTDQTEETMKFFRWVLISCMIIFWIISLIVSYYLAKLNMEPIMKSWQKQQEFVENSSHELRTPLTIIQAKLEKLFTQPNHTILEESEDIALALNEVRRLSQLTTDLLLLARSDSNEIVITFEKVDSHDFIQKTLLPYQEVAASQEKSLTIIEKTNKHINIDPKLLTQLIIILIDNALKYTHPTDQIIITSDFSQRYWQLTISDTGIGLQEENKPFIFDRFFREDKARQRTSGGYGLGLSIAKGIVELHNGTISVESNQPKGTTFIINLPVIN